MEPGEVTVVALAVVAFALVSRRIERWPLTMPMVFVALGALASWTGVLDLTPDVGSIALLAELTLAVILFSDAIRIEVGRLRRQLALPGRLLAVGMPLTIVLGTAMNVLLFPDLPVVQVALLATMLAPTDAALGTAVVEDESVPARDRLALNVESGVNDGLAVPVVAVLTAAVVDESRSAGSWVVFVLRQIGGGLAIGLVVGGGAILALRRAHRAGWSDGRFEQLATLAVPVICLFGAEVVDANAFIAAFVAGLAFGTLGAPMTESSPARPPTELAEYTEDTAQLLAIAAFFVFGNVLLAEAVDDLTPAVVACALLALTVARIVPVWIALAGTGLRWPTRLFLGWFGPRGLASIVFGLLLLEDLEGGESEIAEQIFGVIGLTVGASVVLHGATAAWGAARYGRWSASARDETMGVDAAMPRSRWSV